MQARVVKLEANRQIINPKNKQKDIVSIWHNNVKLRVIKNPATSGIF